ncbi:MAG TPA: hypothetical protein PKE21_17605, partial [Flavobacteriales bacterium]|nr:hypothetical protein [Flavobacteriales bacterium]
MSSLGDTLWTRRVGWTDYDAFFALCLTADGGSCAAGLSVQTSHQFLLARFDGAGDTLWTRRLGDAQRAESCYSIDTTLDGGFILAGYKVQSGGQYDLHV